MAEVKEDIGFLTILLGMLRERSALSKQEMKVRLLIPSHVCLGDTP